jgi:hypothetical protein
MTEKLRSGEHIRSILVQKDKWWNYTYQINGQERRNTKLIYWNGP